MLVTTIYYIIVICIFRYISGKNYDADNSITCSYRKRFVHGTG